MRLTSVLYLGARCLVAAWLCTLSLCTGALAQPVLDLLLVLAVDASGSVDPQRFALQKQGYVAAFRHPRVLQAIQSGPSQSIAVTMVQWTGPALQIQVLPWTIIKDMATAQAFAAAIEATPRRLFGGGTSISGVIDYAIPLLLDSPFQGTRRVLDISGDGSNNRGRPAESARDNAVRAGIVINGLPILALEPGLERYFIEHVIGGPGAFVIAAENYETFAEALIKKLIRELATPAPTPPAARYAAQAPRLLPQRHDSLR
ncbi:MAG: DUF1194 domain-containing protein [Candidatus Tectimicrobiota bacterium]